MSKEYLFLGIIIVLIIFTGFFEFQKPQPKPRETNPSSTQSPSRLEKEENSVTVTVEYLPQKSDDKSINFEFALDTHSIDLSSFNFQKDVIIEVYAKTLTPQKVEEEGATHHRRAEITFKKTTPPFTVVVLNLAETPRREFQFK